jgi:hypothetical protein
MIKKEWTIDLDGNQHDIKLEQGYFSAKKKIRLDDQLIEKGITTNQTPFGNVDIDFAISTYAIKITIRSNGFTTQYDLYVDGISQSTGEPYSPLPPIPVWLWLFVAACGAIPIISLGGAIPVLLGIGGAAICLSQGRDSSKSVLTRVLICSGVTILAWVLFILLSIGIASLK